MDIPTTNQPPEEPAEIQIDRALLRECLRFSSDPERLRRFRVRLLSDADAWEKIYAACEPTRLGSALYEQLGKQSLMPPAPGNRSDGKLSPAQIMASVNGANSGRRARQTRALRSLVEILNRADIVPVLLKGARTLWLVRQPWRQMRDLDLLVPEQDLGRAQAALAANGFYTDPDRAERPDRHHAAALFHEDLPGSVELHRRAGNRYAEQFLPTSKIWSISQKVAVDGLRARVLDDGDDSWHNLVHHFFGHSGFARGLIDLKGLFEFAANCSTQNEEQIDKLQAQASRCACGLAALDLWLAAARDGLGLDLPMHRPPQSDALAAWERMRARQDGDLRSGVRYPGYRETLALAFANERVRHVAAHCGYHPARVRMAAVAKLLPKITRSHGW